MSSKYDAFRFYTGIFFNERNKTFYRFAQDSTSVKMETIKDVTHKEIFENVEYPIWMLRHSFGVPGGHEDYSSLDIESIHSIDERRIEQLKRCTVSDTTLRNMEFNGISVGVNESGYSHAVGPIHAGVIEPGHFRFSVSGEFIQSLTIRLGFQRRNILKLLKKKPALKAIPISETISGDSTVAYAMAFSEIFEQAAGIKTSEDVRLLRLVLLEVERCAIHIGDIGAISGDIGYYPLHGVCATDRGVPLGAMEALVGSRFGKGAIWPGEIRLNRKLTKEGLVAIAKNLRAGFIRVEEQVLRAINSPTFQERLHDCGRISKEQVLLNSVVGMAARCTGLNMDLRQSELLYKLTHSPLNFQLNQEDLNGDAWARFMLRFMELKNSIEWLENVIPGLNISASGKGPLMVMDDKIKYKSGVYFSSIEGWRGPVLVALDISSSGLINQAYIKDPSVTNWHALELAVRGELIGDFPLNNKSFNLSYVGFDL